MEETQLTQNPRQTMTGVASGLQVELDVAIQEPLGRGAFGQVYSCEVAGLLFALKAPRKKRLLRESATCRLQIINEIEILSYLVRVGIHPNVIAIFYYNNGDDATPPFFIMERCHSCLWNWKVGHDLSDALTISQGIFAGIAYLHKNKIMHRDPKPANILVQPDLAGRWTARITDFGASTNLEPCKYEFQSPSLDPTLAIPVQTFKYLPPFIVTHFSRLILTESSYRLDQTHHIQCDEWAAFITVLYALATTSLYPDPSIQDINDRLAQLVPWYKRVGHLYNHRHALATLRSITTATSPAPSASVEPSENFSVVVSLIENLCSNTAEGASELGRQLLRIYLEHMQLLKKHMPTGQEIQEMYFRQEELVDERRLAAEQRILAEQEATQQRLFDAQHLAAQQERIRAFSRHLQETRLEPPIAARQHEKQQGCTCSIL